MFHIFEPSFRLRESSPMHTTRRHNINEAALYTRCTASINPEDAPEPLYNFSELVKPAKLAVTHLSRLSSANFKQTSLFPEPPIPTMTNLLCITSLPFWTGLQSFSCSVSRICFRPVKKLLTGLGTNQCSLSKNYSSGLLLSVY